MTFPGPPKSIAGSLLPLWFACGAVTRPDGVWKNADGDHGEKSVVFENVGGAAAASATRASAATTTTTPQKSFTIPLPCKA
jgi:hypothetical protein